MSNSVNQEQAGPTSVGGAINLVLQTEMAALDAIEESRRQAEAILLVARRSEAEILQRADKRISRIQKKCSKTNKKHIENSLIKAEREAPFAKGSDQQAISLVTVAQQLAARLTHGEPLALPAAAGDPRVK